MHANDEDNGRTRCEASYRCCGIRKAIHKEVAAAGRLSFSELCWLA